MLIGGAAMTCPFPRAGGKAMIGVLNSGTPEGYKSYLSKFRQALAGAGYVEGRNVAMEYRWPRVGMNYCPVWRLIGPAADWSSGEQH
jgi:hypothetical protein